MSKNKIQQSLYFSTDQIKLGDEHAKTLGMSFNSWVKYLVVRELESLSKFGHINSDEVKRDHILTTQEQIDLDKKMIEDLVNESINSENGDFTLPY